MKTSYLILLVVAIIAAGCEKKSSSQTSPGNGAAQSATNATQTATNKAAVAQPSAPGGYLGALMQADKSAVKTIDVSYLNQAVQLFQTQEGRLPKDLNELVPNYVGKLPQPPYGYKIVYDPTSGQVSVVKE